MLSSLRLVRRCASGLHCAAVRSVTILGIETSCDDTASAVVTSDREILSEFVSRQDHVHGVMGGIVPMKAAQCHADNIHKTVDGAMGIAKLKFHQLDAIAVTRGPGIGICLDVGLAKAKALAKEFNKPVVAVNHMEGGGHTMIVVCKGVGDYAQLGSTLDDALGEAYDKTARLLNLEWHGGGGRALEALALQGKKNPSIRFTEPLKGVKNCNFSYSGLKTAVKEFVLAQPEAVRESLEFKADVAFAFQFVAVKHLCDRVDRAIQWSIKNAPEATQLVVSGGVASNTYIRECLKALASVYKFELIVPPPRLCTDNGVMIAWAGMENWKANKSVFSSEEIQQLGYEPKWKLDPAVVDHFPNSHKRDPILKRVKYSLNAIQLAEKKLDEKVVDLETLLPAIRSAINGRDFTKADELCDRGLVLDPSNRTIERMKVKTLSMRQTTTLFTKDSKSLL